MSLTSILADLASSPRLPREQRVTLELPTSTFHRLPKELRRFLMERHIGHWPTWQVQTFILGVEDHAKWERLSYE